MMSERKSRISNKNIVKATKKIKEAIDFALKAQHDNIASQKEICRSAKQASKLKSVVSKRENIINKLKVSIKLNQKSTESLIKRKNLAIDRFANDKKSIRAKAAEERSGFMINVNETLRKCNALRQNKNKKSKSMRKLKK